MRSFLIICLSLSFALAQGQGTVFETANRQEAHLQVNQDFYISGQKLWFSFFLYDGTTQRLIPGNRFMELRLIDRNGKVLSQHNLKVEGGRAVGQFNLDSNIKTDEYLLHLGFQKEAADQYLFVDKVRIYNRAEALSQAAPMTTQKQIELNAYAEGADVRFYAADKGTKQKFDFDLSLDNATEASVSIEVRKVVETSDNKIGIDEQALGNKRAERSLDLKNVYNHPYLQFEAKRLSAARDSIMPLIFVPETHATLGFFKTKGDIFTIDATDMKPGVSTFFFNQFIYRSYVPLSLEWDYQKEKYKDILVPYYEGEMEFEWVQDSEDFAALVASFNLKKPEWKAHVRQFAHQLQVNEMLLSSNAYEILDVAPAQMDSLLMEPMLYRRTKDYTAMDNMSEFLFEIVKGIKAYYSSRRKEIIVLNTDGPYHSQPLILVNGVPTRDMAKVLDLPIQNVEGVGVIKDHKSRGQRKYNEEAKPYGVFGSTGIIVIKLKPDVVNPFRSDFEDMLMKEAYIAPLAYPNIDYVAYPALKETPDLRTTLFWVPSMHLNRKKTNLSFFTSDIPGQYELIVKGIKKGGGFINVRKTFTVTRTAQ